MSTISYTAFPTRVDAHRKHAVSFEVTLMEGVGHFPQIENPEVFQSHPRTVVEELAADPSN